MSKLFQIKESFDKLTFLTFNILSDSVFQFRFKIKSLVKKNRFYKDIHKDDKVFILGNGPSISLLDSDHFKYINNHVSFVVNYFYKKKDLCDFKPTYYALVDPLSVENEYTEMYENIRDLFPDSILITDYRANRLMDKVQFKNKPLYLYSKKYPVNDIDEDISVNCYITMNVVSACILTAIYMGAKEIYLLGCDYNSFASRHELHFYEEDSNDPIIENRLAYQLKYYHLTTEFHYLIAKLAKRKGVKIVNLCDTSLLDSYPIDNINKVIAT